MRQKACAHLWGACKAEPLRETSQRERRPRTPSQLPVITVKVPTTLPATRLRRIVSSSTRMLTIFVYNAHGALRFSVDKNVDRPESVVAAPARFYVANTVKHGDFSFYDGRDCKGNLEFGAKRYCDRPRKLAIMEPKNVAKTMRLAK
jgi:hypothetical protein